MKEEEQAIWQRIQNGEDQAFETFFKGNYVELCRFSLKYVQLEPVAEEIVHDAFLYLWQKRQELQIKTSLIAYLYTSVKNRSLNYLKSQYAKQEFTSDKLLPTLIASENPESKLSEKELQELLATAITQLPTKCKIIFTLRQETEMTYQEIADELGVSKKTVAAQMSIAFKKIEAYLKEYWEVLMLTVLFS